MNNDKYQFAVTRGDGYVHCSFVLESKDDCLMRRVNCLMNNIKTELESIKMESPA